MVRVSVIPRLAAVLSALFCSALAAKGTNTGLHASIDLRTLSQAKDVIFD